MQKLLLRHIFLQFIKTLLFSIILKAFGLVEAFNVLLKFSQSEGPTSVKVAKHWFFDEEHLIFGMINACVPR